MTSVSTIIAARAEGRLCQPTIESALRAGARAREAGHVCETLVALDGADAATLKALSYFGDAIRVETGVFASRGHARDFGATRAAGEALSFLDSGDLMGLDWLVLASRALDTLGERPAVVHARLTCYFGRDAKPVCLASPDMDAERVDFEAMRARRLWTGFGLARRSLHLARPWAKLRSDLGFDDWGWNVRAAEAGVAHLTAPGTIHFVRRSPFEGVADRRGANPDAWPSAFGKA